MLRMKEWKRKTYFKTSSILRTILSHALSKIRAQDNLHSMSNSTNTLICHAEKTDQIASIIFLCSNRWEINSFRSYSDIVRLVSTCLECVTLDILYFMESGISNIYLWLYKPLTWYLVPNISIVYVVSRMMDGP